MTEVATGATSLKTQPQPVQVSEPAVSITSRDTALGFKDTAYDRQIALKPVVYTPVLTCTHCGGTAFGYFAGPTGKRTRCRKCGSRADTAMCSCSHGYGAHAAGGCMGVQDDGMLCECQLRGGR